MQTAFEIFRTALQMVFEIFRMALQIIFEIFGLRLFLKLSFLVPCDFLPVRDLEFSVFSSFARNELRGFSAAEHQTRFAGISRACLGDVRLGPL